MSRAARISLIVLLALIALTILAVIMPGQNKIENWGSSGPANTGRFILLIVVLPILALFSLAIAVTRGRYQVLAVNSLIAIAAGVAIYVSTSLILARVTGVM